MDVDLSLGYKQRRVVVGVAATNRIGLRAMSLTINAHAATVYWKLLFKTLG